MRHPPPMDLVVGAGISGAVIADLLAQRGHRVRLIDRRDKIAGLCYDEKDANGITVQVYGSHIFHTNDAEVWEYLSGKTEFNGYVHSVLANINGRYVPVPFNFESLRIAFPEGAEQMREELVKEYGAGSNVPLSDFVSSDSPVSKKVSEYVYENIFLRYTMKQWGKAPEEVDRSVTARVPIRMNSDCRYFQDRFQGIPAKGFTAMIGRIVDNPLIEVVLGRDASEEDFAEYDNVVYTGSVDELMGYEFGVLPYRSVKFRFETVEKEHFQPGAVVNYTVDRDYTRVHEFKYYLGEESERTVISYEYSEDFVPGTNERCYPVATPESAAMYARYVEAAERRYPNLRLLGRLGCYRYINMDAAVAGAIALSKEMTSADAH